MSFPVRIILAMSAACLLAGCSPAGDSDANVRKRLEVILQDDLRTVVSEVARESVADSTYWVIRDYKVFSEGKYSVLAVVDFHFLKNARVKMVRKYRYYPKWKKWERYYNCYEFVYE